MSTAFLMSILENPNDEYNYLVYADWLRDQGLDAAGDFINMAFQKKIYKEALPEIRQLVQPYLWNFVYNKENYALTMVANDGNDQYIFYFRDTKFKLYNFPSNIPIEAKAPGKVVIAKPKDMNQEKWEVPYVGNIVKNPPENLLRAMVFGNLLRIATRK